MNNQYKTYCIFADTESFVAELYRDIDGHIKALRFEEDLEWDVTSAPLYSISIEDATRLTTDTSDSNWINLPAHSKLKNVYELVMQGQIHYYCKYEWKNACDYITACRNYLEK